MEDKDAAISFQFKRMDHMVIRAIHTRLSKEGFDELTVMHGWMLAYIYHSDRPVFQKDFESEFGISKSTVTNILARMEKKGYVSRVSVAEDARLKQIKLTPEGRKIHLATVSQIDKIHKEIEDGITPEERECFFRIVSKIEGNILRGSKEEHQ